MEKQKLTDEQLSRILKISSSVGGKDEDKTVLIILTCETLGFDIPETLESLKPFLRCSGFAKPDQYHLDLMFLPDEIERVKEKLKLIRSEINA